MENAALYAIGTVALINVVTFLTFGLDKWKAGRGRRRIPEATLIGMAWATGLFGAWLAMSTFRHKTVKRSFKVRMWLVTVFNLNWLLVWAWYQNGW